jgi:transposase
MEKQEKQEAKKVLAELMQAGYHWQEAAKQAGIEAARSTAYSWWQKYREVGESGLIDGRHGHIAKVDEPVLKWIESTCKKDPCISSNELQKRLQEELHVTVSISHLNQTRAVHGWTNQTRCQEKKTDGDQANWLISAGGLLLVAAAQETGLLEQLETRRSVLPENVSAASPIDLKEPRHVSPVEQGEERTHVKVPGESGEVSELSHPKISKSNRSLLLTLLRL